MGDWQNEDLRVGFDSRLKLKFLGSQVTTDAGLLAYRELDDKLGLTVLGAGSLQDSRLGQNKQHSLLPLLRQSIYSRLAGYEDVNDAERLSVDPAMRHVVGGRATLPEKQAASTSEVGRFETETLSTKENLTALMNLSGQWVDAVHRRKPLKELILDMDSSVSETYGKQEGTAYNGHFECTCYHPLFLFNQFGDLEWAMLRRGNNASAKFWRRVLLPVIARYRHLSIPKFFRGDAAFANPALYRLLEIEGYLYAIRIKANAVLEREIEHLLALAFPPQTDPVFMRESYPGGSPERISQMKKTRYTTSQIIEKLRQADVALGKGQKVPDICKSLEITAQTYYRWRQKYGGMAPEMAKQLKSLEKENSRLKKLVAEQALDMEILKEAAQGNW